MVAKLKSSFNVDFICDVYMITNVFRHTLMYIGRYLHVIVCVIWNFIDRNKSFKKTMLHKIAKCKYEAKLLSRKNKTTNKNERMNE